MPDDFHKKFREIFGDGAGRKSRFKREKRLILRAIRRRFLPGQTAAGSFDKQSRGGYDEGVPIGQNII
jgi:hypothetical protein